MIEILFMLAVAVAGPSLKGTWELDAGRSVHSRVIDETVVIGGGEASEDYSAIVRYQGATSGASFSARIDGKDVTLYGLDGKPVGKANVIRLGLNHTRTVMSQTSSKSTIIERRLSIDGNTMISLILNAEGKVESVLVFSRKS